MSVISLAASFTGKIKETGVNAGFNDADFESEMEAAGWRKGLPWCMFYCLMIWLRNTTDEQTRKAIKALSGGTQNAWRNAKKSGFNIGYSPVEGAIAIFVKEGSTSQGHSAMVLKTKGITDFLVVKKRNGVELQSDEFLTSEGNTDESGSREGDGAYAKVRKLWFDKPQKGSSNVLLGFIYPPYQTDVGGGVGAKAEHLWYAMDDWQKLALGGVSLGVLGWGASILMKK